VRGLDYYTRTAFEIVHGELGRTKAVGGGGRYDDLLRELGGPDVSGIGFAIGLERLAMGLPDDDSRFVRSIDAYVAILGESARAEGFRIVHMLRRGGISVETRYAGMSLKAQMKVADKIRAQRVIMIGDDELARQELTVRDMSTKQQVSVRIADIVNYFRGLHGDRGMADQTKT
jgi:histidyl-tRNA synthetase